jgi:hypothetical protein
LPKPKVELMKKLIRNNELDKSIIEYRKQNIDILFNQIIAEH